MERSPKKRLLGAAAVREPSPQRKAEVACTSRNRKKTRELPEDHRSRLVLCRVLHWIGHVLGAMTSSGVESPLRQFDDGMLLEHVPKKHRDFRLPEYYQQPLDHRPPLEVPVG